MTCSLLRAPPSIARFLSRATGHILTRQHSICMLWQFSYWRINVATNHPAPPDPSAKVQATPAFMPVINETNLNQDQLTKRQKLIAEIEQLLSVKYSSVNRFMSYVMRFGHSRTSMQTADIPNIEAVLQSLSGAEQINLLVHSPGGDGTIVEKIVDICRSHLVGNNRKFRVIVPNLAKSAATILALGTDEIIMGYTSELGPIDPQVPIFVSGTTQWVSAFAFVEARDKLLQQIAKATKKNEPTVGLLTELAGLNIPFTDEMENQIQFAKKTAITLLQKYMLAPLHSKPIQRHKEAVNIAEKLLSKALFPAHGYYISGKTAREMGLQVELLDKDDQLWNKVWEYYIRCEVQMNIPLQAPFIKTKLFESGSQVSLVFQDMP
jgi:ClpP class serine protease